MKAVDCEVETPHLKWGFQGVALCLLTNKVLLVRGRKSDVF